MSSISPVPEQLDASLTLLQEDPSILISTDKLKKSKKNNNNSKKKDTNLAESSQKNMNAITRFLESAAAAAAEEQPLTTLESTTSSANAIISSTKKDDKVEEIFITFPKKELLHKYEIDFLLALKESTLIENVLNTFDLPSEDFWRMNAKPLKNAPQNSRGGQNSKWKSNYHNNAGSTGEMGSFSISGGKGNHDRKRNNHKDKKKGRRGSDASYPNANSTGSRKYNNSNNYRDNGEDDEETPEWMLENDEPTGNSALDFEKWKLKMRLEEKKMNGEEITENDLKLLDSPSQLQQLETSGSTNPLATKNSIDSFFSFYNKDEPVRPSLESRNSSFNSLHDSKDKSGSRFSSFFGGANAPPAANSPPQQQQLGSKLLGLINGGASASNGGNSNTNSPIVSGGALSQSPHILSERASPQVATPPASVSQGTPNQNAANSILTAIGAATKNKQDLQRQNSGPPQHFQQQQHQQPPPYINGPPVLKKNDVFFLSLLKKSTGEGDHPASQSPQQHPQGAGPPLNMQRLPPQQQNMHPQMPPQLPPHMMNGPPMPMYGKGPPPPWFLLQNGGVPGQAPGPGPQFMNAQQRFNPQQFPQGPGPQGQQQMPYPPMGPPPGIYPNPNMYNQSLRPNGPNQANAQFNNGQGMALHPYFQQQQQQQQQQRPQRNQPS